MRLQDPTKLPRIIAAAERLFAGLPYAEVHMDLIASEAGVAKGTVYLYFPSKLAVYEAVLVPKLDALDSGDGECIARAECLIREAIDRAGLRKIADALERAKARRGA